MGTWRNQLYRVVDAPVARIRSVERIGACPLHDMRGECWDGCLPECVEMARIGRALSTLWFDRKHGMKAQRATG